MTDSKREPVRFKLGQQNVTEAGLSDAMRDCDLIVEEEGHLSWARRDATKPMTFVGHPPDRDRDSLTVLGWNRELFRPDGDPHAWLFHGSGSGSPDVPDGIKTARRFIFGQRLIVRATEDPLWLFGAHVIQGYDSSDPDPFKAKRLELAEHSFDVMQDVFDARRLQGDLAICGADINTVHRPVDFKGMRTVRHQLDRVYFTRSERLQITRQQIGPKVGLGSQSRHNSIICTFQLTPMRGDATQVEHGQHGEHYGDDPAAPKPRHDGGDR